MTIIWALQSRTRAKSANRRVQAPQAQAVGGLTWGSWGMLWAPPAGSGAELRPPAISSYIQIKSELILTQSNPFFQGLSQLCPAVVIVRYWQASDKNLRLVDRQHNGAVTVTVHQRTSIHWHHHLTRFRCTLRHHSSLIKTVNQMTVYYRLSDDQVNVK